jgi:ABC-type sugar transport system substrate-binding protein
MAISKFAAVAIAASLLVGTAGCTFNSPVASRIEYAPADGSQADLETIKVRNFVYVTNGTLSALAGSIVNPGTQAKTLTISYTDAAVSEQKQVTFTVNPGQKLDLGYNGGQALAINLGGKAGDVVTIKLSEGSTSTDLNVPVLDSTFDFYKPIIDSLSVVEPSTN